jgi:hypothetical protein
VSILVPLEATFLKASDLALDNQQLVRQDLFERLNLDETGSPFTFHDLSTFTVVAARLDLCDRKGPGPCHDLEPQLRLVLQPVENGSTADMALHAFYAVPAAELSSLLTELNALARMQELPAGSPLQVSPALKQAPQGAYAQRLATLLKTHCSSTSLIRLTFFAQPDIFAAIRWVFKGVELQGDDFVDIRIPSATDGGVQHVLFLGDSYDVTMMTDVPKGLMRAHSAMAYSSASPADQLESLAALTEVNNPLLRSVDTLQCVACHTATPLLGALAKGKTDLPGRYESDQNLALDGGASPETAISLRAFGWFREQPMISQRVVNETAQVLHELASCRE